MKKLKIFLIVFVSLSIVACSGLTKKLKPSTVSTTPPTKVSLKQITLADLKTKRVYLTKDVQFRVSEYIRTTDFRNDPQWKKVFSHEFKRRFLTKKALYQEKYEEGGGRLVVTRTLTLNVKDPCSTDMDKETISFCFKPNSGELSKGIEKGLKGIRIKIERAIKNGDVDITEWAPLLDMSDEKMLSFLLNRQSKVKKVIRRSVIPYIDYQMKGLKHQDIQSLKPLDRKGMLVKPVADNTNPITELPPLLSDTLHRLNAPPTSTSGTPLIFSNKSQFEKKYVMGNTFGRTFGDVYTVVFAGKTRFTDKYYASFTYDITYGFGLRFPFILKGESTIDQVYSGQSSRVVNYPANELCAEVESTRNASRCARGANVSITALALDAGPDFYRSAGVSTDQVFRGKEFVLELGATCALRASIPGPNLGPYRCPNSLSNLVDESRDFSSQLGRQPEDLAELLLSGRAMGLAFEAGIGYAAINPGVVLQAHNGMLSFDIEPYSSITSARKIELKGDIRNFYVRESVTPGNAQPWGYAIDNPKYRMNAVLVPRVEVEVGIDVGIARWDTTFGPYDLDNISIDFGRYSFDSHPGVSQRKQVRVAIRDSLDERTSDGSMYFVAGTNCRDGEITLKNYLCQLESLRVTSEQCNSLSYGQRVRKNNGEIVNLGFPNVLRGKVDLINCIDNEMTVNLDYCSVCTLGFDGSSCNALTVESGDKISFTGDIRWDGGQRDKALRCLSTSSQVSIPQ